MQDWIKSLTYRIEKHASKAGLLYRIARRYYTSVIEKEAVLANITSTDHVLCIGGGMCPFTAILFHQVTGARVTVIDKNKLCVPEAQQIVDRLGLGEKVHVLHECAGSAELDYSRYSVIHIALQVSPIEQVFSQAAEHALSGTRLLMRRPRRYLDGINCKLSRAALASSPYTTHKSRNIGATLLYTKQAGTVAFA